MKEVCIVPTFSRSDMLWVCLEAIRAAEPNIDLHCFPDRGTDESKVCEQFDAIHHLTIQHSYSGNSFNMLGALKWAHGQKYDRVFVVEDDAIVDSTFFSWCRENLDKRPDVFAACGWQYSPDAKVSDGPDLLMPWYLSVCACLPRKSVASIIQHARPEYYSDMGGYLDRTYPNSYRRGSQHFEQDGLALRVCESESKRCVWPRRPRATHVGFTGYHMGEHSLEGTLEERVAVLKLALKSPAILKDLMSGGPAPDMDACMTCGTQLLTKNKNVRVVCCACFHRDHPSLPVTTTDSYYLRPLALEPALLI